MTVQDVSPALLAPASFAQERLWFLEQLESGDASAYNVGVGFRLSGPLDRIALERTLTALVERHETLRTTFRLEDDALCQVIAPPHDLDVSYVDLDGVADPDAALNERVERELHRPFDLATGPVVRASLLRLGAEHHVLLLVLDHIVCDAWSLRVLHRDFVACYTACVAGAALPEAPPIQYADYAEWQRAWLDGGEMDRQLDYWRERLADPPPKPSLPRRHTGDGVRAGGTVDEPLPADLVERLRETGRAEQASLFMLVTAAFATLLHRYSGQDDLVIGTLVANRNQAEVEDLVGFFTNTAALRCDLTGAPTARQVLARIRDTALGAYAHQDVPFHRVVEALQPERRPGEPPYFTAMIQLADVDRPPATIGALRVDPVPLRTRPAPVELVVSLLKEDGRHRVIWDFYESERVDATVAARMHADLLRLLDGFAEAPDRPVAEIPLPDLQAPDSPPIQPVQAEPGASRRPDGEWEVLVAEVWSEVLGYGLDEIGATDDFFDLGGHSLAAGRVISRINRRTGVTFPTRLLFDEPVLHDLAAALRAEGARRSEGAR